MTDLPRKSAVEEDPPVDRCPWCEEERGEDVRGTVDWRITIDGRHVYRCPNDPEHRWQDANETPSYKGAAILRGPSA